MSESVGSDEQSYRAARARLERMRSTFLDRAQRAEHETAVADGLIWRKWGWLSRLDALMGPLLWVALLPVCPLPVTVLLLWITYRRLRRAGHPGQDPSAHEVLPRLRWAHTDHLLVLGPLVLTGIVVAVMLLSPRTTGVAGAAVDVARSSWTWVSCVREAPEGGAKACTDGFQSELSTHWTEASADNWDSTWWPDEPMVVELDRVVTTEVAAQLDARWPLFRGAVRSERARVIGDVSQWFADQPELSGSWVAGSAVAGLQGVDAVLTDIQSRPVTWLLVWVVVGVVVWAPRWAFRWMVARRAPVTYLSERHGWAARERATRIGYAISDLDARWRAQQASRNPATDEDWLASFLVRGALVAVAGATLGAGVGPAFAMFGDLVDLAGAAEGLAGAAELSEGFGGFEGFAGDDPSQYGVMADAVLVAEADPFLVDVNGDGLADVTSEGTPVHWTDGYVRDDGTVVRGYYATNPDEVVFNNLSYLRARG